MVRCAWPDCRTDLSNLLHSSRSDNTQRTPCRQIPFRLHTRITPPIITIALQKRPPDIYPTERPHIDRHEPGRLRREGSAVAHRMWVDAAVYVEEQTPYRLNGAANKRRDSHHWCIPALIRLCRSGARRDQIDVNNRSILHVGPRFTRPTYAG